MSQLVIIVVNGTLNRPGGRCGLEGLGRRKGPGLPYQGVQVLLTTWTACRVCGAVVAHLDQRLHDDWHAGLAAGPCPPVLERAVS